LFRSPGCLPRPRNLVSEVLNETTTCSTTLSTFRGVALRREAVRREDTLEGVQTTLPARSGGTAIPSSTTLAPRSFQLCDHGLAHERYSAPRTLTLDASRWKNVRPHRGDQRCLPRFQVAGLYSHAIAVWDASSCICADHN